MYNGVMYPYKSPAHPNPDSVRSMRDAVATPEDALRLAKMLVQQGSMDAKPRTPEEAQQRAAILLKEFMSKGVWDSPAQNTGRRAPPVSSPKHNNNNNNYARLLTGANKTDWTPVNAKALEDKITASVDYYKRHVKPTPATSVEDALVDRLSIAYVDSMYCESRRASLAQPQYDTSDDDDTIMTVQEMAVAAHNVIRSKSSCPSLTVSLALMHKAAAHAAVCTDAGRAVPLQGTNVHFIPGQKATRLTDCQLIQAAVDAWVREGIYYQQVGGGVTGLRYARNYTQLVWASSRCLGSGVSRTSSGAFVVCCYDPVGNKVDNKTIRLNVKS